MPLTNEEVLSAEFVEVVAQGVELEEELEIENGAPGCRGGSAGPEGKGASPEQ